MAEPLVASTPPERDGTPAAFISLAETNELVGVIDLADFNDEDRLGRGKEMVGRLSKLIGIFEQTPRSPRWRRAATRRSRSSRK